MVTVRPKRSTRNSSDESVAIPVALRKPSVDDVLSESSSSEDFSSENASSSSHAKGLKRKEKVRKYLKWILILIVLVVIWRLIDVPAYALELLQLNPAIWKLYLAIAGEVESKSLLGLFYASFLGSIFFISLPVEVIFLHYLTLNYYVVQIVTIVMIGNFLGMLFNYACGRLIGERAVKYFMKDSYDGFRKRLERAGAFIILIGNIVPFPIEPFAVFLGAVRYNFKRFLLFTIVGKIIKFALLAIGYVYFLKFAAPYLSEISVDWFIEGIKSVFIFW